MVSEKPERTLVAGDLHGDLESFSRIREEFKERDLLLFLGDYADRGNNGVEVIEGLKELIECYPKNVIVLKGNHEDYSPNGIPKFSPCNLISEVEEKVGNWREYFEELEKKFLDKLNLAALVPGKALFVHGGVSSKIRNLTDLVSPSVEIEEDLLWSDPYQLEGELLNPRGAGVLFGPDITRKVTQRLGVKYVIRSHEPTKAFRGPAIEHEGKVITLSSTRVYGGRPFLIVLNDFIDVKKLESSTVHLV